TIRSYYPPMSKNKLFRFTIFIIPLVIVFSQCLSLKKKEDPRGAAYAGSATCVNCHKNIYGSYLHTAHFISSVPSDPANIQGSLADGANEFIFSPHVKIAMEKRSSGVYQATYVD